MYSKCALERFDHLRRLGIGMAINRSAVVIELQVKASPGPAKTIFFFHDRLFFL
jgi:hypothetical protein